VTEQKGLNIGNKSYLHNPTEALAYCLHRCPKHKLGCAVDCNIRKVFKIPPHGSVYPGVGEPKKLVKW